STGSRGPFAGRRATAPRGRPTRARFFQIREAHEAEAQVVMGSGEIGPALQRLPGERDPLLVPSELDEGAGEVAARLGVARLDPDGLAVVRDRLVVAPQLLEGGAQV